MANLFVFTTLPFLLQTQFNLLSSVVFLLHEVAGSTDMLRVFNWRIASVVLVFFGYLVILHFIAVVSSSFIFFQHGVMGWNVRLRVILASCSAVRVCATDTFTCSLELSVEFASILQISLFSGGDDVKHAVCNMALSVSLLCDHLELSSVLRLRAGLCTNLGVNPHFFTAAKTCLRLTSDQRSDCLHTSGEHRSSLLVELASHL